MVPLDNATVPVGMPSPLAPAMATCRKKVVPNLTEVEGTIGCLPRIKNLLGASEVAVEMLASGVTNSKTGDETLLL